MNRTSCAGGWGVFIVCLALSGCRGVTISDPMTWRPPERKDPAIYAVYGPTASEKIDQLRRLAEDADSLSPQRQREYSASLVKRFSSESDAALRVEVARTLGAFSTDAAAEGLRLAMNDVDRDVRIAATHGWANRGDDIALRSLAEMLHSESDIDVRLAAARSLEKFRDPRAVTALSIALDDRNPALRRRLFASLREASGRDFGNNVVAWQDYAHGRTPIARVPQNSFSSPWWKALW